MNHVVDTSVLIVASAHFVVPEERDATPAEPELRAKVFAWLDQFSQGNASIILDYEHKIFNEYLKKLSEQDFGIQVVISKLSRNQVRWVSVKYDRNGHALLPSQLKHKKWDNEDKKFGSAAFAIKKETGLAEIVNSSDTDWYDVHSVLAASGIGLRQLIDGWCRATYRKKNRHEPPVV